MCDNYINCERLVEYVFKRIAQKHKKKREERIARKGLKAIENLNLRNEKLIRLSKEMLLYALREDGVSEEFVKKFEEIYDGTVSVRECLDEARKCGILTEEDDKKIDQEFLGEYDNLMETHQREKALYQNLFAGHGADTEFLDELIKNNSFREFIKSWEYEKDNQALKYRLVDRGIDMSFDSLHICAVTYPIVKYLIVEPLARTDLFHNDSGAFLTGISAFIAGTVGYAFLMREIRKKFGFALPSFRELANYVSYGRSLAREKKKDLKAAKRYHDQTR